MVLPTGPCPTSPPPPAEGDSSHTALFAAMRPLSNTPGAARCPLYIRLHDGLLGHRQAPGPLIKRFLSQPVALCLCLGTREKGAGRGVGAGRAERRPAKVLVSGRGAGLTLEGSPNLFLLLEQPQIGRCLREGAAESQREERGKDPRKGGSKVWGCGRGSGRGCGHFPVPAHLGRAGGGTHLRALDAARPPARPAVPCEPGACGAQCPPGTSLAPEPPEPEAHTLAAGTVADSGALR